jgi:hypothetical protein
MEKLVRLMQLSLFDADQQQHSLEASSPPRQLPS